MIVQWKTDFGHKSAFYHEELINEQSFDCTDHYSIRYLFIKSMSFLVRPFKSLIIIASFRLVSCFELSVYSKRPNYQ